MWIFTLFLSSVLNRNRAGNMRPVVIVLPIGEGNVLYTSSVLEALNIQLRENRWT